MPAPFPWWSRKWWYPNCCCKECIIYHDDCRGTEVNDIYSTYWHEIEEPSSSVPWSADAFDSTVSFGEIGYACGDGFLICKTEITESPYNCVVGAKFLWATATDTATARMVVDYVDEDNFHYVDVDHDGSRTGDSIEVRFYDRSSGSDTQIGGTIKVDSGDLAGWPELYIVVCKSTTAMQLNIFSASASYGNPWPPFDDQDTSFFAEAAITNKGGKQAGVGMKGGYGYLGGSRSDDDYGMRLQEFWLERTADENSNCEACQRLCCSDTLPMEFDVTLDGFEDSNPSTTGGGFCLDCTDVDDVYTVTQTWGCCWEFEAGYATTFFECDYEISGVEFQGARYTTVRLCVSEDLATNNAIWELQILEIGHSSKRIVWQYDSGQTYPAACALDGTETWTETMNTTNCKTDVVTVSVQVG